MPLALIPILLLVVPILEIAAFIVVGQWIGLWPTLGLVVVSAVMGALLLRQQGLQTFRRIQAEIGAGRVPGRDLVHGAMILAAGILLLTPGLVTDAVGYLLFVPALRDRLWRLLSRRMVVTSVAAKRTGARASPKPGAKRPDRERPSPGVVDLSADDYERRSDPSSPWRGSHGGNRTLH